MVGRNGAATRRRPISSHSTASSTMPIPRPPSSSGSSIASHPCSAMADQTALVVAPRRVRRRSPPVGGPGSGERADDRPGPDPGAQGVGPGHPVEERGRGVAQGLLVAREVEVHGGAVYGRRLTRVSPRAAAVPCCGGWICTPRPSRSRCGASFRAWLMEHLPWPYGVGLAAPLRRPGRDGRVRAALAGRAGRRRLGRPDLARGVRRPRPGCARELRGDRGAGPGPGTRAGRPHRHQPGRARPCWPTGRPSRRSASCPGSSRPPSCGASSSASPTPGATWPRSPPAPSRSRAATGSAGARCGPRTPSSPTGASA